MDRKQTIIDFLSDNRYPPVNIEEMMLMLDIPFDDREELSEILSELVKSGKIIKTSKRKYASPEKLGYIRGKFSANERGFGFVLQEGGDLFVPLSKTLGAVDGDMVLACVEVKAEEGKRSEGKIVKIISRENDTVVGTFRTSRNFGFVETDDKRFNYDVYISKKKCKNAKDGQKVVAKITKWYEDGKNPEGEIAEVLGYPQTKGVDILSVIKSHHIETEFGQGVKNQCENICETISEADIASREDFRQMPVITIDGDDSRDFDDAVCVMKDNGGFQLYVHIADVAHYVTEQSPLDREAKKRGTSVYFPDRVVPMLPEKLSNGICSLNPEQDRLTLSVVMKINSSGHVIDHRITEGVICSKARMTYSNVIKILENDVALCEKYADIKEMLFDMKTLAEILRSRRMSAGSIDFDFPETKVVLDENGKATDAYKCRSEISNKIIEEFMLITNQTVAEEFFWADIPFVYRVHEKPSGEKIAAFNDFSKNMGYRLGLNGDPHPGEFAALLNEVRGTKREMLISKMMLRSLMKAKYSECCDGHFGLAFKFYCHFTSPIRRYPDLAIHRIIKEFLRYGISDRRYSYLKRFVKEAAQISSEAEIKAMEAEREALDMKKAEYMRLRVGEKFSAIVSSVTNFGFFAELENGIEGLVRLADLKDDYYVFDERDLSLCGERTRKTYHIGDTVEIVVAAANPATKQIDFCLAD